MLQGCEGGQGSAAGLWGVGGAVLTLPCSMIPLAFRYLMSKHDDKELDQVYIDS